MTLLKVIISHIPFKRIKRNKSFVMKNERYLLNFVFDN